MQRHTQSGRREDGSLEGSGSGGVGERDMRNTCVKNKYFLTFPFLVVVHSAIPLYIQVCVYSIPVYALRYLNTCFLDMSSSPSNNAPAQLLPIPFKRCSFLDDKLERNTRIVILGPPMMLDDVKFGRMISLCPAIKLLPHYSITISKMFSYYESDQLL